MHPVYGAVDIGFQFILKITHIEQTTRLDLDHTVKQGPSDIWRNAEIRREDYF